MVVTGYTVHAIKYMTWTPPRAPGGYRSRSDIHVRLRPRVYRFCKGYEKPKYNKNRPFRPYGCRRPVSRAFHPQDRALTTSLRGGPVRVLAIHVRLLYDPVVVVPLDPAPTTRHRSPTSFAFRMFVRWWWWWWKKCKNITRTFHKTLVHTHLLPCSALWDGSPEIQRAKNPSFQQ